MASEGTTWEDVQISRINVGSLEGTRTYMLSGEINGVTGTASIPAGTGVYRSLVRALKEIAVQAERADMWQKAEKEVTG